MLPFNRIYFDSNLLIAAGWPRLSAELENLLRLALRFEVALFLPQAVELELEEHWFREFDTKCDEATSRVGRLKKYVANVTADGFILASPDRNQLQNEYRIIVQDLKEKWAIASVPLTSRPLDEIFRMSIRRVPPFQEEGKGFQDTVILLSVIDHLCEATGQVGAFISRDTDFKEQEVTKLTGSIGAQIKLYKTINEISQVLMDQMREIVKSEWERDQRHVAELLKTMLPQIEEFITKNLEVPKWQLFLEGRIVAVPRIEVT